MAITSIVNDFSVTFYHLLVRCVVMYFKKIFIMCVNVEYYNMLEMHYCSYYEFQFLAHYCVVIIN